MLGNGCFPCLASSQYSHAAPNEAIFWIYAAVHWWPDQARSIAAWASQRQEYKLFGFDCCRPIHDWIDRYASGIPPLPPAWLFENFSSLSIDRAISSCNAKKFFRCSLSAVAEFVNRMSVRMCVMNPRLLFAVSMSATEWMEASRWT